MLKNSTDWPAQTVVLLTVKPATGALGVEVYKSNDKYFEWDGGERSPGVYYYYIKYTKSEYKGSVTIVY